MQQSPQKSPPRQRDRRVDFDAFEEQGGRQAYRAAPPRARKFHVRDDEESPRARGERRSR
jgi:hypothetical protein